MLDLLLNAIASLGTAGAQNVIAQTLCPRAAQVDCPWAALYNVSADRKEKL